MRWPGGIRRAIWVDFSLLTGYQVEHNWYAMFFGERCCLGCGRCGVLHRVGGLTPIAGGSGGRVGAMTLRLGYDI